MTMTIAAAAAAAVVSSPTVVFESSVFSSKCRPSIKTFVSLLASRSTIEKPRPHCLCDATRHATRIDVDRNRKDTDFRADVRQFVNCPRATAGSAIDSRLHDGVLASGGSYDE